MGIAMKFLVIGLGSMGKRRIRNLLALRQKWIAGFDLREDRRQEAEKKYGVRTFDVLEKAFQEFQPNTLIVSTPPDKHMEYAYLANDRNVHCFIEASVTETDKILRLHQLVRKRPVVIAPSCTMMYYPGPKKIKELVNKKAIGKVLNINYQTGLYLLDWHPWEKIEDFYVSKRETGGCREIVAFELAWLNDIFGKPVPVTARRYKLTDIPADIDDIYHFILRYPDHILANITIEVISRPKATREMRILGSEGEIVFSSDYNHVKYMNARMKDWKIFFLSRGSTESGCINPEEPYIMEMKDFIKAAKHQDPSQFPNDLLKDYEVLKTLADLENMDQV